MAGRRRGSVRELGKGKFEVIVSVPDPLTGNHRKVSRRVTGTRKQAEDRLAKLITEINEGDTAPKSVSATGSYAELLDAWLAQKRTEGLSPSTVSRYAQAGQHLRAAFGDRKVADVTPERLDALYAALSKKGLGGASILKTHRVARGVGDLAVRYGLIRTNPAIGATRPRITAPTVVAPETETVQLLIDAAAKTNPTLSLFLRVGAATGMRRGELAALRWSDCTLNGDDPFILVARNIVIGENGKIIERPVTKTGKPRRVSLDSRTTALLVEYQEGNTKLCAELGGLLLDDGWVFSSQPDGSTIVRPDTMTWAFSKLCTRLGIEGLSLYGTTRHYAASTMIANDIDPVTAAARLGHSPTQLLRTYGHLRAGKHQQAAALVGGLLA